MKVFVLSLFLAFGCIPVFAQFELQGKVVDALNGQPLAFVNMIVNGGKIGSITDIDGKFRINHTEPIRFLQLSYVGYEPTRFEPKGVGIQVISLARKAMALQEISVIAGENPAHRVIKEAVRRREENHPEKLPSFTYTAYNRLLVTLDTTKTQMVDTIQVVKEKTKDGRDTMMVDSTNYQMTQFFRSRDIFLTESVSERSFVSPDLSYEKVIATRTSGIKNPIFMLLATQLQSFSFYDDYISILSVRYLNPVSPGSTSRYFFNIEDTLYQQMDTVYVISFKPLKNAKITGMKGVLYINTHGYAIQNVLAEPVDTTEGFQVRIRQLYQLVGGQRWFPVQLNTDILFTSAAADGIFPLAVGRSYLQDIEINPGLRKRDIPVFGAEIVRDATKKPIGFWEPFTRDNMSDRDLETYRFIDSISEQFKLERRLKIATAIATGRLPLGAIDLRLRELFGGSRYEGFRTGVSLATNEKLSPWFSIGGYLSWGFLDKQHKYGLNADVHLDRRKRYVLRFYRHNDLILNGGYSLFTNETSLINPNPDRVVYFFNRFFDREQATGAAFRFLNFRYLSGELGFHGSYREQTPWFHYRFVPLAPGYGWNDPQPEAGLPPAFNYREFRVQLRYAFREKVLRLTEREFAVKGAYPVVYLNYQRGVRNWGGDFDFHRAVFRIEHDIVIRNAGVLSWVAVAGGAFSDNALPIQQLFYMRGLGRNTGIYVPLVFQTFDMNDFGGNQFASIHLRHNFESLFFKTATQQPIFAIHHNSGWSRFNRMEDHFFTEAERFPAKIADARMGYHESGVTVSNIQLLGNQWGVGLFYRYGPYSSANVANNFAVKLVLTP